jgi:hypothetical protein
LKPIDLNRINEIYETHYKDDFSIPNLNNCIGSGVVVNDSEIIGFGMIKLYPEAIILLDKSASSRNKSLALKTLFNEAKRACFSRGFEEFSAHTIDDNYTNLLIKHFKFEPMEGKRLLINLEE